MLSPCFTALLGIAFMAPAVAQQAPTPPAPPQAGGGYGMRDPLARMDTNGDGVISRDEMIADADRRFARLDTNGDGKITADEMQARMGAMARGGQTPPPPTDGSAPPAPPPGGGRMAMGMMRRADANGDGVITREEFRAAELQRFAMMDANHDGTIDANERAAAMDAMGGRMGWGGGRRARAGTDTPPPPPSSPGGGQ